MDFFNPKTRIILGSALVAAIFTIIACFRAWQPGRQVERHHAALLEAVGERDWKALDQLIDPAFKHPKGHDKAWVLKEAGEVRRHFFALTVNGIPEIQLAPAGDSAVVHALIRLEGSGTAVASYVISEVNSNSTPFTFHWKKMSWKPWDWQLTAIDHPFVDRANTNTW